jgi:hypothetical protein
MIKSRGMAWVGGVEGLGENENAYRRLMGKPEQKNC